MYTDTDIAIIELIKRVTRRHLEAGLAPGCPDDISLTAAADLVREVLLDDTALTALDEWSATAVEDDSPVTLLARMFVTANIHGLQLLAMASAEEAASHPEAN